MNTDLNMQEQKYKNPGFGTVMGGVMAGSAVQGISILPQTVLSTKIMNKMIKLDDTVSKDEFIKIEKAITDTIKNKGLDSKGVGIIKATKENAEEITKIVEKELNSTIAKYFPEKIKKAVADIQTKPLLSGQNAYYTAKNKKIIMPENKLGLALFHEMGHAMNANLSKIGRILQKCRPMTILALPIELIALLKTKKAPDEEPKNGIDKVTTFIKDNAGKLTFATFLPMMIEEGLATIKGNKLAKQLTSPEIAKKVAKTNMFGFATYLLMAICNGVGIYLGTKVKDSIASKKLVNENI